ncbi:MAG: efflux RND transporter permease subunit [Sulfurovum sp.]|nr:efflux RND transporter permease subunit [Sulfurovum sp.]
MIRKFIEFAIDRPILNHILFILLLIMAVFAYKSIPKEIFPPSQLDKVSIAGGYAGASADVLDKIAVRSIEEKLKNISNTSNIATVIQNGAFHIVADIKSGSNKQLILGDIKDMLNSIKRDLPSDMDEPITKLLVADFPLLLIAISGDKPKQALIEVAEKLKNRLSDIKELNAIDIRGDADKEVRVKINESKLRAYNISKTQFFQAISGLSSIYPAGTFKQSGKLIYLSTKDGIKDAKEIENTLIDVRGRRIRVGDVATVSYALGKPQTLSHFNGKQNISINTTKTSEGNAIALSKQIKEMISEFQKEYSDITIETYVDTSVWIKNRINLVIGNIIFGLFLVFLALFISVNWRIATVVAIGIPASFFIALVSAEILGYSMNMLTMLGALIALGMLVDEAIVVGENIFRHMEMGKSAREAAIEGSIEMFPAVLTATATTVFAFLPLLIMGGQLGMFVKVLPVMISILLISSLFEAFYFLPLHSKELYTIGKTIDHHKPSKFWDTLNSVYGKVLGFLLSFKKTSLLLIILSIVLGSIGMMKILKFELFPMFDGNQIYISGKVDINNRLDDTQRLISNLEQSMLDFADPDDISNITSIIGIKFNPDQTFETGEHLFQIFINLHERKPKNLFDKYINPYISVEYDEKSMIRNKESHDILHDLEKKVLFGLESKIGKDGKNIFRDISAYVPQAGIVTNDIEIGLVSSLDAKVFVAIEKLEKKLKRIDGVTSISNNAKEGPLELKLKINSYGYQLGFNEANLISSLRGLFMEAEYGKILDSKGLIRIRIEDINKEDDYDIYALSIDTPDDSRTVLLKDIVDFVYQKRMLKLYKEGGQKIWTVAANIDKEKILSSDVMDIINPILKDIEKSGVKVVIKGEEKENQRMIQDMTRASIIAIFLIFISLILMFNSLLLPLIVLSNIPLSIFGALVGTYLFGLNLNTVGIMGFIGLAGVVVNDGLIMLDFIKREKEHKGLIQRAQMRIRPILLTSITTVLGLSTIMFFASGQSLIVQPMAVALGCGVAWSTLLNLIYVPLMYAVLYRVKQ